jgi:hypothetical protein
MQGSEWRRDPERTLGHRVNGMASGAIGESERLAALLGRGRCHRRTHHEERKTNLIQTNLHLADLNLRICLRRR